MPYILVEPELVVERANVAVYRAYNNNDFNDPLSFWFALYPFGTENDACRIVFDARTLKAWPKDKGEFDVDAQATLEVAIDTGEIRTGIEHALPPYVDAHRSEGLSLLAR